MTATRKTATAAELAKMSGKTIPAVTKQMKRHGVQPRNGRYNIEKALSAMALGASLDKRNTEKEIKQMEAKGIDSDNIVYKSKLAQYRKVVLQGDILEAQRDEARGDLANKEEVKNYWVRIYTDQITAVNIWQESETAKHPQHRAIIKSLAEGLRASMTEVLESHQ